MHNFLSLSLSLSLSHTHTHQFNVHDYSAVASWLCVLGTIAMGCCLCRPDTDIAHDVSVSAHARVGNIAFVYQYGHSMIKGCCSGLMYIREDVLYYETVCSGRLCCKCCRRAFNGRDITSVEVVTNRIERFQNEFIVLNPGLKITVKSQSGSSTTIIVAMPDAQEFAAQLNRFANLNQKQDF